MLKKLSREKITNNDPIKSKLETIQEDIVDDDPLNNKILESIDTISSHVSNTASIVSTTDSIITASSSISSTANIEKPLNTPINPNERKCCSAFWCNLLNLKIKGFLRSFIKLIGNFRYTLLIIIMSIECILIAIFTHYLILYSQNIYQISSSKSSILVGGVIVPAAIIGAVFGGLIVRKFDLYIEGCTRLIMLSSTIVVIGICVLLFIKCEATPSLGIDTAKQTFSATNDCNKNCNCHVDYSPVCGIDKVTYLSPCFAGCLTGNLTLYFNCACVSSTSKNISIADATNGACARDCDTKLIIFLAVLFIVVTAESLCLTPITMLLLKLVDKPLHPFALGVLRMANILLAYIPAPIILSQVIDKTCILWNSSKCIGDQGTCLEYDPSYFHYILFGTSLGIKVVSSFLLVIFSLYIHKSYVLKRRYHNKVTLNHDVTSILASKQKYKVDSIATETDDENERKSVKKSTPTRSSVILKNFTRNDEFTSLDRSATPDFFLQNLVNRNGATIDGVSPNEETKPVNKLSSPI